MNALLFVLPLPLWALVALGVCITASWAACLRYDLMMFQQNSYRYERFFRWLFQGGNFFGHSRGLALMAFAGAFLYVFDVQSWLFVAGNIVVTLSLIALTVNEFRSSYRVPLVYTARIRRLIATDLILSAGLVVAAHFLFGEGLAFALALPLFSKPLMLLSNLVATPMEKLICNWYIYDAKRILKSRPDLIIIGVTGSYGKTGTKNFLYRMLSQKYSTLMTPGNYNTTLGVVRTIREQLRPQHKVFIVEMGAKQVGDIKEICDLVHPRYGIVTSVGKMHLETFGCLENIQSTKFELIRSLPSDGFGVYNADSPGIASYNITGVSCPLMGYSADARSSADSVARALDISYDSSGAKFTIAFPDGEMIPVHTPVVGDGNILNILGAAALAHRLGVDASQIRIACAQLRQVEHRLSISSNGLYTIIDDAYNANPDGSAMALRLLKSFGGGGKKIVITPGYVEMGSAQEDECRKLGAAVALAADYLIVVNVLNRKAIVEGALGAGMAPERVLTAGNIFEAMTLLQGFVGSGDTVLLENDFPDSFK